MEEMGRDAMEERISNLENLVFSLLERLREIDNENTEKENMGHIESLFGPKLDEDIGRGITLRSHIKEMYGEDPIKAIHRHLSGIVEGFGEGELPDLDSIKSIIMDLLDTEKEKVLKYIGKDGDVHEIVVKEGEEPEYEEGEEPDEDEDEDDEEPDEEKEEAGKDKEDEDEEDKLAHEIERLRIPGRK